MPILTLADTGYLSGLTLSGNELLSAIRSAQALAESAKGANRELELRQYVEKHEIGATRSFFTSKLPIVNPIIRVRSKGYSSWGRVVTPGQWTTLQPSQFEVDGRTGEITVFLDSAGATYPGATQYRVTADEVEITYSSGFAFAEPTTGDARTIKQSVADILRAMQSQAYSQGIGRYRQERVYDVEFSGAQPVIDNALMILQKFAPRGI